MRQAALAGILVIFLHCATKTMTTDTKEGFLEGSGGTKIFYRIAGRGSDTIVAIHGGPGMDSQSLAPDLAPLERTHRMIYYDQRGGGRSELPSDTSRLTLADHVADLEALRAHFGLETMTLLAHSFGPAIAANYALRHPDRVRRMIFIGPIPPMAAGFFDRFSSAFNARLSPDERKSLEELDTGYDEARDVQGHCRAYWKIAVLGRVADRSSLSRMKSDFCSASPEALTYGRTKTGPATWESMGDWDWRSQLANLRVPTLVIHGEEEAIPMDMVEQWVRSLPEARLVRVPHAAHFPHFEQPDIVFPAIEEFLKGR